MKEIKEQPGEVRRGSEMMFVIGVKDRFLIGNVGGILIFEKMAVVDYKSIKYVSLRNWVEIVG